MFKLQPKCFSLSPEMQLTITHELELPVAIQRVVEFWGKCESSRLTAAELEFQLNKHCQPLDNAIKKAIIYDLLYLINFTETICPENGNLVVAQLNEPIKECTAGLVTQLNILTTILSQKSDMASILSMTFNSLMRKVAQEYLADWGVNEIHTHNYLMVLASNLGIGIKSANSNDVHLNLGKDIALTSSGKSEGELQKDLKSKFRSKYDGFKFFQEIISVIQQQLCFLSYTGRQQEGYKYNVYSSIQQYFDKLFKKEGAFSTEELFIIDSETQCFYDINWISVIFQLVQYLKQEQLIQTDSKFEKLLQYIQKAHHELDENIFKLLEEFFLQDSSQIVPFFEICKFLGIEKRQILLKKWLPSSPNPCGDVIEFFKCEDTHFLGSILTTESELLFSKPIQFPSHIHPLTSITFLAALQPERKAYFLSQIPSPEGSNFFADTLYFDSSIFNKLLDALKDIAPVHLELLCLDDKNPLQLLFMAPLKLRPGFRNQSINQQRQQMSQHFSPLCAFLSNLGCLTPMFTQLIEDPSINAFRNLNLGWEVNLQVLQLTQQLNMSMFNQKMMQLDSCNNNLLLLAVQKPHDWFVQLIGLINQSDKALLHLMFCQTNTKGENIFTLAHTTHLPMIYDVIRNLPDDKRSDILELLYKTKSIFCAKNIDYINTITPLLLSLSVHTRHRIMARKDKNDLHLFHYAAIHSSLLFNKLLNLGLLEKPQIIELLLNVGEGLNKNCLMLALEHQPHLCKTIIEYCSSSQDLTNQFFRTNANGDTLWSMVIKGHCHNQTDIIMFYLNNLNFTKAFLKEHFSQNLSVNILALCSSGLQNTNPIRDLLKETYQSIPQPQVQMYFLNSMLSCLFINPNMSVVIETLISDIPSLEPHFRYLINALQLDHRKLQYILNFNQTLFKLFMDAIDQTTFRKILLSDTLYYDLRISLYDRFTYVVKSKQLTEEVCQVLRTSLGDFKALLTSLEKTPEQSQLSFFSPSTEPNPPKRPRNEFP